MTDLTGIQMDADKNVLLDQIQVSKLQQAELAAQVEILEKKSSVMNRTGLTNNSGLNS
jgi:hypothetical protein